MIYELSITSGFNAAHKLRSYKGKKEDLHGHNWSVEARISAGEPDDEGMVMDFALARECVDRVLDELDHKNLNDIPYFAAKNPTAERIARMIYENLEKVLAPHGAEVCRITLWETPESAVIYREPSR